MDCFAGKVVVVTGASSGIGRIVASSLANRGALVVAAARSETCLRDLAQGVEGVGRIVPVAIDVTDEEAVRSLAGVARREFAGLDVWVNNAGVMAFGRFETCPPPAFRQVIETNFFGYVYGARVALETFRRQGHGTLINVSSYLGKLTGPNTSAYNASKFAIQGFAETLREELVRERRIHVCNIVVGGVDTPIYQQAANYSGRRVKPSFPLMPAEKAANLVLRSIERPKRERAASPTTRVMMAVHTVAPSLYEWVGGMIGSAAQFSKAPSQPNDGNLFQPEVKPGSKVSTIFPEGIEPVERDRPGQPKKKENQDRSADGYNLTR